MGDGAELAMEAEMAYPDLDPVDAYVQYCEDLVEGLEPVNEVEIPEDTHNADRIIDLLTEYTREVKGTLALSSSEACRILLLAKDVIAAATGHGRCPVCGQEDMELLPAGCCRGCENDAKYDEWG